MGRLTQGTGPSKEQTLHCSTLKLIVLLEKTHLEHSIKTLPSMNGKSTRHASGTSTPALHHTATTRPLVLLHTPTQTRVSIHVPSSAQEWIAAEVARDTFQDWLHEQEQQGHLIGFDAVEAADENDVGAEAASAQLQADRDEKQLVLSAYFLRHVASLLTFPAQATSPQTAQVLLAALSYFSTQFLDSTDVHSLSATLAAPIRSLVIGSYYSARTKLEISGLARQVPKFESSSLLRQASSGESELYALFGGQGMNEVYFDELQVSAVGRYISQLRLSLSAKIVADPIPDATPQQLYDLYAPLITPFLARASEHLENLAAAESTTLLYENGLSALSWLQDPETRPLVPYLASCAVSLPLIGLTQLAQYVVYGKGSLLGPAELGAKFNGATGHSQGVISACVIAAAYPPATHSTGSSSDAWEPFYAHACHGLTVLFQIGLQGSLTFPPIALPPQVTSSAVEAGEGVPTPMLAVTGLEIKVLEKKISEVNGHVTSQAGRDASVSVSLHNGPRAFVVTGNPKDLVGLAEGLRKIRAPSGKDQSKVESRPRLFLQFQS